MNKEKLLNITINIISILLLIILMIIYVNLEERTDIQAAIIEVSYVALTVSMYCIITSLILKMKWYNLFFLYLVFFVIFIFGQVFNKYIFNFIDEDLYDLTKNINMKSIAQAIIFSVYCLLGMHIGGVSANLRNYISNNNSQEDTYNEERQILSMRLVAMILLIISTIFAMKSLFNDFKLAINGGYSSVYSDYSIGIESWREKIIPFFNIGLLLLMVSYKNNIKVSKCIFWIDIIYNGIQIFLGARGIPILSILAIMITWHISIRKIQEKTIAILIILIIPLATLISMIRVVRSYPISDWISNASEILIDTIKENPISTAINEMGTAIYPTAATISIFPDIKEYKHGITYLYGIQGIIPNLGNELSKAKVYGDIQEEVAQYYGLSFGGSIIEDLYANFGKFAILCMVIIGFLMNKIQIKIEKKSKKNVIIFPLYMITCVQVIWTVRNTINPIFRYFVWYILTTYILYKIIYTYLGKKNKGDCRNE